MKQKIFAGVFVTGILVFLSSIVLVLGAMAMEYNDAYEKEIKSEAYLLSHAVEISGKQYFAELELSDSYRITWVDADGTVLYDSLVDELHMGNHGDRPEVQAALKTGYGEDTRYSNTLSEKTMYSAVKLEDGTVLRVSQKRFTVLMLLREMLWQIGLVVLIAVLLSLGMASLLSNKIVMPLSTEITRLKVDVDEKTKEADFRKEFTANVSHELKTPLTSISGFAELMKEGFVKEEDTSRFAGKIYEEAQRLIVLVEDIIKLSQLDEKQISEKKEQVDLYHICEDALYMLQPVAERSGITLELEGEHLFIDGVRQILSEIVYNLCDNAIKYNREHGAVRVCVYSEDGCPAILVEDTGIGIAREDMERVFERFFRVNKSHSKEIGGTGLGLSIVKHGAAYHNARIHLDSKLGEGTKITIIFR